MVKWVRRRTVYRGGVALAACLPVFPLSQHIFAQADKPPVAPGAGDLLPFNQLPI